jgi:hypothetical protein
MSSSQLTNSYFSEGLVKQQPGVVLHGDLAGLTQGGKWVVFFL